VVRGIAIAALVALLLAGCGSDEDAPAAGTQLRVGDATVRAEVADDDAERALGLGGRDALARDAGMYFVLRADTRGIWMKGMRFPLDLVWIEDDRVVEVTARVPNEPPGTPDAELPIYSPSVPANRVLEVNAGWAREHGVRRGDRVSFENGAAG
jgi:uncharacterized membrane protein (UPF0127 family)